MTEFIWFLIGMSAGVLSVVAFAAIYVRVKGPFTVEPPERGQ